jgi:hypothetical protein
MSNILLNKYDPCIVGGKIECCNAKNRTIIDMSDIKISVNQSMSDHAKTVEKYTKIAKHMARGAIQTIVKHGYARKEDSGKKFPPGMRYLPIEYSRYSPAILKQIKYITKSDEVLMLECMKNYPGNKPSIYDFVEYSMSKKAQLIRVPCFLAEKLTMAMPTNTFYFDTKYVYWKRLNEGHDNGIIAEALAATLRPVPQRHQRVSSLTVYMKGKKTMEFDYANLLKIPNPDKRGYVMLLTDGFEVKTTMRKAKARIACRKSTKLFTMLSDEYKKNNKSYVTLDYTCNDEKGMHKIVIAQSTLYHVETPMTNRSCCVNSYMRDDVIRKCKLLD